jgi:transcriptional regulator with XRE-family HTH domain
MNVDFNTPLLLALGSQISSIRKERGLTQAQLAELLEVEPETVSRFERGTAAPSLQRLVSIASALGVGVQHLLVQASPLMDDKFSVLKRQLSQISLADQDLVINLALTVAKRLSSVQSA